VRRAARFYPELRAWYPILRLEGPPFKSLPSTAVRELGSCTEGVGDQPSAAVRLKGAALLRVRTSAQALRARLRFATSGACLVLTVSNL